MKAAAAAAHRREQAEREKLVGALAISFIAIGVLILWKTFVGDEKEYQSDWHVEKNITLLYPLLQPGDLIEYYRDFSQNTPKYSHWAVYIGTKDIDGTIHHRIIHHSGDPKLSPIDIAHKRYFTDEDPKSYGVSIREDDLVEPAHGHLFRVNNAQDLYWERFELDEVVMRAKLMKADPEAEGYNLFTNNCQHFVYQCRYGKKRSPEAGRKFVDFFFALFGKSNDPSKL